MIYISITLRFPYVMWDCAPNDPVNEGNGYKGIRTIKIFEFENLVPVVESIFAFRWLMIANKCLK